MIQDVRWLGSDDATGLADDGLSCVAGMAKRSEAAAAGSPYPMRLRWSLRLRWFQVSSHSPIRLFALP